MKSAGISAMPDKPELTVIAFDFGMKRIGVAVGQTVTGIANPLPMLPARDGIPHWDNIQKLIDNWQAEKLIVGHPINMDGSTQLVTHAAKRFSNRLRHRFSLPVELVDERLTTVAARDWAYETKSRRHQSIDSVAAKLILEGWLRDYSAM